MTVSAACRQLPVLPRLLPVPVEPTASVVVAWSYLSVALPCLGMSLQSILAVRTTIVVMQKGCVHRVILLPRPATVLGVVL